MYFFIFSEGGSDHIRVCAIDVESLASDVNVTNSREKLNKKYMRMSFCDLMTIYVFFAVLSLYLSSKRIN